MRRLLAIVHSALLAARSPPWFSRCRMVLPEEASTGLAPHMAAHMAAKAASLWSRSGLSPAVSSSWAAVCTQALWRSSSRGAVRLSVLVMTASRLAIWSSRASQRPRLPRASRSPAAGASWAQARARWSLRSGRSRPCSSSSPSTSSARIWLVAWVRALIALRPGHHQGAELSDGAVAGVGDGAGVTSQHGAGCCLGVDRVAFALAPPPGAVGAVDLDHVDALVGQVLGEPVAVAASALDPGGGDLAVAAGPGHQVGVGSVGGAKGARGQVAAEPVQQDRDVDVLVGV